MGGRGRGRGRGVAWEKLNTNGLPVSPSPLSRERNEE